MKKIFLIPFVFLLFLTPGIRIPAVYAETHITAETIFQNGTEWTKTGSPYILDDSVSISQGQSLYIDPGVVVLASSTPDDPISIFSTGDIAIAGSAHDPVTIDGLDSMNFTRSNIFISNAVLSLPDGINMFYSTSTIASSTINGGGTAISIWGSQLDIKDSTIADNDYGIYSYYVSPGPFLSLFGNFTKRAIADVIDDPKQNHISIAGSRIIGNRKYGIYNETPNVIVAQNNWWGDAMGPSATSSNSGLVTQSGGDGVFGPVNFTPWLSMDPDIVQAATSTSCCSNVLFLPGIEASRLYTDQRGILARVVGTTTDQLWEPNDNADVQKLFMNNAGQSINSSVYVNGIIDDVFGFGIYKNFIAMMDGMVQDGTIQAWKPFAYDWRYGVDSIVNNIPAGSSTSELLSDFQSLASSSKTGKVTIVAHSDGGLVAKMLAKTLADKGESGLIDKVIMIAVPEVGTPQAVASLLHGDGQALLGGIVLNNATARELGDDSPGAYGLLPSKSYFDKVASSVISFASSTMAGFDFSRYGNGINSYQSLRSFLTDASHQQSNTDATTNTPAILSSSLLDNADRIHDTIDNFLFASSTPVISLIGWGNATMKGIRYYQKESCYGEDFAADILIKKSICTDALDYEASTTYFGDGTVLAQSAGAVATANASGSKDYYFNLRANNSGKLIGDSHATILNTASGISFVKSQITADVADVADAADASDAASNTLPPFISDHAPTAADLHEDDLVVTVHSPVELDVYDANGAHTGPIPNPDPTSDLGRYETNIPGSSYDPDENNTSVTVPYGTDYTILLKGTGTGSFSIDTQRNQGDTNMTLSSFDDLPVTPLLKAELTLATTTFVMATSTSGPNKGKVVRMATTSQLISLDFDGDGIVDATTTSGTDIDPTAYLRSMERTIRAFHISAYREKVMCDKIEKIISYMLAKKPIKIDAKAAGEAELAMKDIGNKHWIFKNIDQSQKDKLTAIFQSIIDSADI